MEQMTELVSENLKVAQHVQKKWNDQCAKERERAKP